MPKIKNVLLADGLQANLVSISQLGDSEIEVRFNQSMCQVLDDEGSCVMHGKRLSSNCYLLILNNAATKITNLLTKTEELILWHKKTGYMNLKNLIKISNNELLRGFPKSRENQNLCVENARLGSKS